ncbi:hypothetical protein CPB84DRAFT_1851006 [Gymnopilus junonius]|uniref:Uncharacterized protein n=1 Tax=Gymnopilus junonius TaxID=109634 RepID=A0A9P5NA99_GYMJU|nr:hypothetical protein CPB84DRAFT_1854897 [Gymnopilus junonius]KAF8875976.1 hypothetical protein CPB84DRAFT_1853130 [Gymnopilus junonius]KAF8883361.1 hypothetical protein CPB84DRAFT_1851006 [Gymnopilus junonius]
MPLPIITQCINFTGMWTLDSDQDTQDVSLSHNAGGQGRQTKELLIPTPHDDEMDLNQVTLSFHSSGESEISKEEDNDDVPEDPKKILKPQGEPRCPHSGGHTLTKMTSIFKAFVKDQADKSLNTAKSYKKQLTADIIAICKLTAKHFPILEKYKNNWPVHDTVPN